jgi:hypothetical protein
VTTLTTKRTEIEERALDLIHTIDPGFVNRRLVHSVIGPTGMELVDKFISQIPPLPDGLLEARVDHAYSQAALLFCEAVKVKTLGELLASGNGRLFCSTEQFDPCPDVTERPRVSSTLRPAGNRDHEVVLEYSTAHLRSDTYRIRLHDGATLAVIAHLHRKSGNTLYFEPLIIGGPWLSHPDERIAAWAMWRNLEHFENYIDDFDEFEKVRQVKKPVSCEPMRYVGERAFKACLTEILKDAARPDWGGETSDHFTSTLRLNGKRVTGAFVLKGPAHFAPMGLNHLGKNNDQIYRLSQEPADILFVQHCHEIEPPVRATLRAFTVQPGRLRRYCLIDGKDSLRLLIAYGLYDHAVALTKLKK